MGEPGERITTTYTAPLQRLADINGLGLRLGMQGKKRIRHSAVKKRLQLLLLRLGVLLVLVQGGAPAPRHGTQALGGLRVVQPGAIAEGVSQLLLGRGSGKGRIGVIGGTASRPYEAQVAQEDALEVTELAIVREQQRGGAWFGRHGSWWRKNKLYCTGVMLIVRT